MPLDNLGFDGDPELLSMILRMRKLQEQGTADQEQFNQPYYKAADQAQRTAGDAKTALTNEMNAPEPQVDPAQANLQRSLSSMAELLSPGKGFGAAGESRNKEREQGLVRRRVERLQLLEKTYDEEAKRARSMGDNKLYLESLKKGEKAAKDASDLAEAIGGISKIRIESNLRMKEQRQKHIDNIGEQANKFKLDLMKEYGITDPSKLPVVKAAFKKFDAIVQAANQYQKSLGEGIDSDPDAGLRKAQAMIDIGISDVMDTIGASDLNKPKKAPATEDSIIQEHLHEAMQNEYSLNDALKVLRGEERRGMISDVDAKVFYKRFREEYGKKDKLVGQITSIDKDLNNRQKLRYKTSPTIVNQLLKRREKLVMELREKFGLDALAGPSMQDQGVEASAPRVIE